VCGGGGPLTEGREHGLGGPDGAARLWNVGQRTAVELEKREDEEGKASLSEDERSDEMKLNGV
jgi:hypothetical protein